MEQFFNSFTDKLKAIKELKDLGINNDQAVDIVFESIQENERIQFMQEVFKIAFNFGQLHQYAKQDANYKTTDREALNECIKECTNLINL